MIKWQDYVYVKGEYQSNMTIGIIGKSKCSKCAENAGTYRVNENNYILQKAMDAIYLSLCKSPLCNGDLRKGK